MNEIEIDQRQPRSRYISPEAMATMRELIANPPPPTPRLIEAMREYRAMIERNPNLRPEPIIPPTTTAPSL